MKRFIQKLGVLLALFAVTQVSYADNMTAMRWFSQIDPSWRYDSMGTSGNTIGSHGCVITCVAMAMDYYGVDTDPEQLNQWLSNNNGYVAGELDWNKLSVYTSEAVSYNGRIDSVDNVRLNQELDAGRPVILAVNYAEGHFVLCVGRISSTYYIVDPLDYPAKLKTLASSYGTYTGMRLLSGPAQNNLVGYSGSWNVDSAPQIVDCYGRNGGRRTLGTPVSRTIAGVSHPATVWTDWWRCYTQIFDGGSLGECAIVYDFGSGINQAFPMHGQLWNYYKTHEGSQMLLGSTYIGGPVDSEQYATDNSTGHQLVVQEFANGYLTYDTVTGVSGGRPIPAGGGDPDFTIALVPPPGPLPDLTLQAQALTPTSIQVWGNAMGQSFTEVYFNDSYVGQLQDNTLVISSLQEQTSYQVHLRAIDNFGNVLDTTEPITVTTPAFPSTTAPVTLTQAVSVSDWPPPVVQNDTISLTFTIQNTGSQAVTLIGAVKQMSGSSLVNISSYSNTPVTLQPGASWTFSGSLFLAQTGSFTLKPVVKNPKLEARNSKQITMIQNPNFKNVVGCLTPNLFWRYNRVRI